MINTDTLTRILYLAFLSVSFGFVGFFIGKEKNVSQIHYFESQIKQDSLKLELVKKDYELRIEKIHHEIDKKYTTIDTANVRTIDSIWGEFGF